LQFAGATAAEHIAGADQAAWQSNPGKLVADRFGLPVAANQDAEVGGCEGCVVLEDLQHQIRGEGGDSFLQIGPASAAFGVFVVEREDLQWSRL